MPHAAYLTEKMGSARLTPDGPFQAGSFQELTLTYTAGLFGIDDSGMMKISWRTTSDMAKPQFTDPAAANFTTVEASNGAVLEYWVDRLNIRPWVNTLLIRVNRGFLREGDTLTVRFGDRRQGSPGLRLQTNCEERFEFKVFVDVFATYEFTELGASPAIELIAGPPVKWKAILPSQAVVGEPFRLAIAAEDMWGNATRIGKQKLSIETGIAIRNLPASLDVGEDQGPIVLDNLTADAAADVEMRLVGPDGAVLATANPMCVVAAAEHGRYWGDLHAQSGETVGTNPAASYFRFARDRAFLDIVGHQGNDFQITDEFWQELNRLTASFDAPGKFVCVPGYEWSGNTGLGGDRNIFYRREGRPIHRSSHILSDGRDNRASHTAHELFESIAGEDAVVIAHVGGRYADIGYAHDGRLERAVEIHSSWGTFEWLLHDAFEKGYRVGIVCHSDDHKGRPGATTPGASTFGAMGGLTCYSMRALDRDSLFEALRRRSHYGTTGMRLRMEVRASFPQPVTIFDDDPKLGSAASRKGREVAMGNIVAPGRAPMTLEADIVGTAPIERVDVLHGMRVAESFRPFGDADLGNRVRIRWEGAEYRGRGRETRWEGKLTVDENRIMRFAPVNFLNPERRVKEVEPGRALAWSSVTTGNNAGLDLWLERGSSGTVRIDTNIVSASVDLGMLRDQVVSFDGGGLQRKLSIYRLPEQDWTRRMRIRHEVAFGGGADLPVYLRVTQADGNQAWSSPIYLID